MDKEEEAGSSKPAALSPVIVHSRQRGNPILKLIRNVRWEFGETKMDFELGGGCGALYLSIRFHKKHPDYVHVRFKEIRNTYRLQVLLINLDVDDPEQSLKELNRMCFLAGWTLIVAHSVEEAAEYLESYKICETRPAELLKEQPAPSSSKKLPPDMEIPVGVLTAIRTVNEGDAVRLLNAFGSLAAIAQQDADALCVVHGLGFAKAQRIYQAFRNPFLSDQPDT